MAKSHGFHGVFSGKVGGNVYFRNKASKMKQGVRTYVANPINPKSLSQAEQRMRMAPAVNCYRALKEIIDRGFQGRQYGNESRLHFLSLAMKREGGPYLMKGNKSFVPGYFQISEGSLIPIQIMKMVGTAAAGYLYTDLFNRVSSNAGTIASLSQSLISQNTDISNGDQITIIVVDANFVVHEESFIVDTENNTPLTETNIYASHNVADNTGIYGINNVANLVAGAVIHSREGESGQHLRSNATLFVDTTKAAIAPFYTEAARVDAIASYMASASSVDWPEVPELVSRDFANLVMVTVPRQNAQGINRYTVVNAEGKPIETQPENLQMLGYMSTSGNIGLLYIDEEVEAGGEHAFYPLAADAKKLTYNSNAVTLAGTDAFSDIDLVYNNKYGHL